MNQENLRLWIEHEIKKYEFEMREAERLHLWNLKEKYFLYLRCYLKVLKKINGGNNGKAVNSAEKMQD